MKKNKIQASKTVRKHGKILGINVISTSMHLLLTEVEKNISCNTKFSIMTPNPELVLMAQNNSELKIALNSADYAVPDGVGLAQASKFLSLPAPKNKIFRLFAILYQGALVGAATIFDQKWLTEEIKPIKGRVLFEELVRLSVKKNWKVFLLGGNVNEAELTAYKLQKKYSNLEIKFDKFIQLDQFANPVTEVDKKLQKDVIDRINKFAPELLFVAFGNPKQEIWIRKNLKKLNILGIMAVGGTFRYEAGVSPLPPVWMEKMGLEWLWRLVTEPKRVGRTFNAFPLFPLRVFIEKLRINFGE